MDVVLIQDGFRDISRGAESIEALLVLTAGPDGFFAELPGRQERSVHIKGAFRAAVEAFLARQ
jgi:hypothetical protein